MLWKDIKSALEAQGVKDDTNVSHFYWASGEEIGCTSYPDGSLGIDGDTFDEEDVDDLSDDIDDEDAEDPSFEDEFYGNVELKPSDFPGEDT